MFVYFIWDSTFYQVTYYQSSLYLVLSRKWGVTDFEERWIYFAENMSKHVFSMFYYVHVKCSMIA